MQEIEYYTPEQLADKLQIARKTVIKHTLARRWPGQLKVGGQWRYRVNDIEKALMSGRALLSKE